MKFYFREFLGQNVTHSLDSDRGDIAHVYNRGNDFYNWFLGETMVYTSGIFRDTAETLEDAQERKLDTVCKYVQMKPGDEAPRHRLRLGHVARARRQALRHRQHGHHARQGAGRVRPASAQRRRRGRQGQACSSTTTATCPPRSYDKITCLEMAEHVGIKNFQKFLLQVRSMLKDDGIFYLQIAGLRRPWQYEDLVWGLFMAKYIFPGADASCPLGFVVSQAERAGFEVHRVENCGVHYSVTIHKWYENWKRNEAAIVAKYGQRWYRMWMMFLGWSVIVGGQGGSTVFMITMSKNIKTDKSTVIARRSQRRGLQPSGALDWPESGGDPAVAFCPIEMGRATPKGMSLDPRSFRLDVAGVLLVLVGGCTSDDSSTPFHRRTERRGRLRSFGAARRWCYADCFSHRRRFDGRGSEISCRSRAGRGRDHGCGTAELPHDR